MAALRFRPVLLWVHFGCAASSGSVPAGNSAPAVRYRLENRLSACVVIENETASWRGDIAVLELRYDLAKSTGECGCKSALLSYASYAELADSERYLIGGALKLTGSDAVTLPLMADKDLLGDAAVHVSLGCETPD